MTRAQLEHVIRAAGSITNENPIVVVGSQSILGQFPDAPAPLNVSMEADVAPLEAPGKADLISGAIGEITHFQETFGYYAHGLPPDACPLPEGWKTRLVRIENENTRGYIGLCLHPHDLAASKLAAGRSKDVVFVRALVDNEMISVSAVAALIETLGEAHRAQARRSLAAVLGGGNAG